MAKEDKIKLLPSGVVRPEVLVRPDVLDPYSPDLLIDGWICMVDSIRSHAQDLGVNVQELNEDNFAFLRRRSVVMRNDFMDCVRSLSVALLNPYLESVPTGYEKKLRLCENGNYVYSFAEDENRYTVPFVQIEIDPREISTKEPTRKIAKAVQRVSVFYEVSFRSEKKMGNSNRTVVNDNLYETIWYRDDVRSRVLTMKNNTNLPFVYDLDERMKNSFFDSWKMGDK